MHSRLILWQIFLKQTHTHLHTDAHTRIQTGVFPVLRRWGHQQCTEPGRRDRQSLEAARKRNRTDETKTARPVEDPTVDIIVPERSACWQGLCVENKDTVWMGRDTQTYKYCAGEHSIAHLRDSQPVASPRLWNLSMEIPIQFPWYRRAFPHRLPDLSLAEPLIDWPLIWPFSWSSPWMRPSYMRWFNWAENGHSEVKSPWPWSQQQCATL